MPHPVSDYSELVALVCVFQNDEEEVAALRQTEALPPLGTGTRGKVQVVRAILAVEVARHASEYRFGDVCSHPPRNEGWGTLCPGYVREVKGWATLYNRVGVVKAHVECPGFARLSAPPPAKSAGDVGERKPGSRSKTLWTKTQLAAR